MNKQIEIPRNCPSCGSKLELQNMQLFCKNILCPAIATKGLEHFTKTIGIKGLGEKTIEKLTLTHYIELYSLTLEELIKKLGSEKLAIKLMDEINNSKNVELPTIIASFGIPLVGKTIASKLSLVERFEDITYDMCRSLGVGDKASTNLIEFIHGEFQDIKQYLPITSLYNNSNKQEIQSTGKKICITGKLSSFKTKAEAKRVLEELNFTVVDNLTKSTDILVDEENKGSSKRIKADELGIKVITNLLTFINEINNDN